MGKINLEKDYITKDKLREICRNNGIKLNDRILHHYKYMRLIKPSIMLRLSGHSGTTGFYKKNTPKILYIIQSLKKEGYKIKLKNIKYFLDITINLFESFESRYDEIKNIKEEDRLYTENVLIPLGITRKKKEYLLKKYPLKLFNRDTLITKLDILKRITKLEREFTIKNKY